MNQPHIYKKINTLQMNDNTYFLDKFSHLVSWKDDEKYLEIGAGDGKSTFEVLLPRMPQNFSEFVVSDRSETMVEYVKTKYGGHRNVSFIPFDVQTLEVPKHFLNEFNHVVTFFTLQWVQDMKQTVNNIYRMLKPGGQVFAVMAERQCTDEIFYNLSRNIKWSGWEHEKYVSNGRSVENPWEEWKKLFSENGFTNIQSYRENRVFEYPNEESFNNFFISMDPVLSKIPDEEKLDYLQDYLKEIKKSPLSLIKYCEERKQKIFCIKYAVILMSCSKPC